MSGPIVRELAQALDPVQRLTAETIAERYNITPRVAREWCPRLVAAGAASKVGRFIFGRWSSVDDWVIGGGKVPSKQRRGAR